MLGGSAFSPGLEVPTSWAPALSAADDASRPYIHDYITGVVTCVTVIWVGGAGDAMGIPALYLDSLQPGWGEVSTAVESTLNCKVTHG